MRQMIKTIVLNSPVRFFLNRFLFGNSRKIHGKGNTILVGKSLLTDTSILMEGKDNRLCIGDGVRLFRTQIVIRGNGCKIHLAGPGYFSGKILCGDEGSSILVNSGVTAEGTSLVAYEGTSIEIDNDCALSWNVEIHSSDSHAIYDAHSGKRLNTAQNVKIHRHVWVAQGATILKGSVVGEGAIVGAKTLVSRATPIPPHTLAVGIPARIAGTDVVWTRERSGMKTNLP